MPTFPKMTNRPLRYRAIFVEVIRLSAEGGGGGGAWACKGELRRLDAVRGWRRGDGGRKDWGRRGVAPMCGRRCVCVGGGV